MAYTTVRGAEPEMRNVKLGNIVFPKTVPLRDPQRTMKALEWHGNKKVTVANKPRPLVTEPKDAIIQITSTTICGSDLHLYHHEFSGLKGGDVLGHEFMGTVEAVGDQVKNLKPGDRVVVSAVIADGTCTFCQKGEFSLCESTNPSKEMEALYGDRIAGIFGYSHLLGGYDGGQAEFARVPYADVNCLKVPEKLRDEQVLFLSDIACTGWHANVLGEVKEGDTVAIWGLGPVGMMAAMWAKFRGAKRVIGIDNIPDRLFTASTKLGIETINFNETNPVHKLKEMIHNGPDVCIDAVGFRYSKGLLHSVQRAVRLETDTPEVLTECIMSCKKGGIVSIVGDYYSLSNGFPIGAAMEKGLTMRGSQVYVQKYWKELLGHIESGKVDPTFVISHHMPLEKADEAYEMFDKKEALKIILKPSSTVSSR